MKRVIKVILLVICLSVFIFSGYKVYSNLQEEKANKKINEELTQKAISKISNNLINDIEEKKKVLPIKVDFSFLKEQNKDITAWIYSENTQINYPVVQSQDNQKYLRKLINGSYNTAGTIFMDYRNDKNWADNNTILYGHNMKNGTMFGTLQKYKKQKYYDNHKTIYLFTEKENYEIELFAAYTTSENSEIYNLSKLNQEKIENIKKNSDFKSNVQVTEEDKIITLSTCAYEYEGARYVVMGKLENLSE